MRPYVRVQGDGPMQACHRAEMAGTADALDESMLQPQGWTVAESKPPESNSMATLYTVY